MNGSRPFGAKNRGKGDPSFAAAIFKRLDAPLLVPRIALVIPGSVITRLPLWRPAMEAGLADHVWELEEIIGLLDANERLAA